MRGPEGRPHPGIPAWRAGRGSMELPVPCFIRSDSLLPAPGSVVFPLLGKENRHLVRFLDQCHVLLSCRKLQVAGRCRRSAALPGLGGLARVHHSCCRGLRWTWTRRGPGPSYCQHEYTESQGPVEFGPEMAPSVRRAVRESDTQSCGVPWLTEGSSPVPHNSDEQAEAEGTCLVA